MVGGDMLGYVDRVLDLLDRDHRRRRPKKPADPGILADAHLVCPRQRADSRAKPRSPSSTDSGMTAARRLQRSPPFPISRT